MWVLWGFVVGMAYASKSIHCVQVNVGKYDRHWSEWFLRGALIGRLAWIMPSFTVETRLFYFPHLLFFV